MKGGRHRSRVRKFAVLIHRTKGGSWAQRAFIQTLGLMLASQVYSRRSGWREVGAVLLVVLATPKCFFALSAFVDCLIR